MAERFHLSPLPAEPRHILRGGGAVAAALGLPTRPCRSGAVEGGTALWLGPDEWLVLGPCPFTTLAGLPHSLVDISDRNLGYGVDGPGAARLLSCIVMLDLHPAAFPVGMCARTLAAKTEIVLWRQAPERFRIEVWRSFAPYLLGLLAEAGCDPAI